MAQVAKNILLPETEDDDTPGPVYDFNYGCPLSQIVLVTAENGGRAMGTTADYQSPARNGGQ